MDSIASDGRRNEKHTKELSKKLKDLDERKVEKDHFSAMLALKADKKELSQALNQEQFDECVVSLDRAIENLKQDIFGKGFPLFGAKNGGYVRGGGSKS